MNKGDCITMVDDTGGGKSEPSDKAAASALALGHPKSGSVPQAWGMKDQSAAGVSLARRQ